MKIRTKFITAPKKHLFTNVIFCADCGKGMWYRSNRQGYVCGNYARHGKKACSSHFVKEVFLKDNIIADIQSLVEQFDKEQYIKHIEARSKKSKIDLQKQINKINKQVELLKSRKSKYINMLADEQISQGEYREIVETNNSEVALLLKRQNELSVMLESEQVILDIEKLKDELLSFLKFNELTPEILHRLINKIEVNEDGAFKIHYRFSAPRFE